MYVINADIKETFLQFPVYESNRDWLAFLCHKTRGRSQQSKSTLVTSSE
jgi:hypothetical protein